MSLLHVDMNKHLAYQLAIRSVHVLYYTATWRNARYVQV